MALRKGNPRQDASESDSAKQARTDNARASDEDNYGGKSRGGRNTERDSHAGAKSGSDQFMPDGVADEIAKGTRTHLTHNRFPVLFDSIHTNPECSRDFLVGVSLG